MDKVQCYVCYGTAQVLTKCVRYTFILIKMYAECMELPRNKNILGRNPKYVKIKDKKTMFRNVKPCPVKKVY